MMSPITQILELDCFTVYGNRIELQMKPVGEAKLMCYVLDISRGSAAPQSFQVGRKYQLFLREAEGE